ncbi:MAG: hypothetical protein MI919_36110 [Holophagales bacterium]|nr:hypothetical protein [Holophagales bacterium]
MLHGTSGYEFYIKDFLSEHGVAGSEGNGNNQGVHAVEVQTEGQIARAYSSSEAGAEKLEETQGHRYSRSQRDAENEESSLADLGSRCEVVTKYQEA